MKTSEWLFFAAAFVLATAPALAQTKSEEIGNIRPNGALVSLMVMTFTDKPMAGLYVADRTGVKTNLVAINREQLQQLRALIDQTESALDKAASTK